MNNFSHKKNLSASKHGFTLVELLVAIAIIGILSSIVFSGLSSGRGKSRDAQRLSDLKTINGALENYFAQNGTYPSVSTFCSHGSPVWSNEACWQSFVRDTTLLPTMPKDPLNTGTNCGTTAGCYVYSYCQYNNGASYVLEANLESPPSPAFSNPSTLNSACAEGGPNWYLITN